MYGSLAKVANYIAAHRRDMEGDTFEDFYYTNFLKDGEFYDSGGESDICTDFADLLHPVQENTENEAVLSNQAECLISQYRWSDLHWGKIDLDNLIHNDQNAIRKACELLSREFWLPILARELTVVDPEVIVPTGKKATEAVHRLCEIEQPDTLKEVALSVQSTDAGITIIPTYHLSRIRSNAWRVDPDSIQGLPEEMRSKSGPLDRETYLEILGYQIKENLR